MGDAHPRTKEKIRESQFREAHLWECATCSFTGVAMCQPGEKNTTASYALIPEERTDRCKDSARCFNTKSPHPGTDARVIPEPENRITSGHDCNANESPSDKIFCKPIDQQSLGVSCVALPLATAEVVPHRKTKANLRLQTSASAPTSPQVSKRPFRALSVDLEPSSPPATRKSSPTYNMNQDVYQRQPLLPGKGKVEWDLPDTVLNPMDGHVFYGSQHLNGASSAVIGNGNCSTNDGNGIIRIEVPAPLREEPKFPREKFKTFVAFLFAVFNSFCSTLSLAMVHEKVPDREKYDPLPDVFLDNVSPADWGLDVSESLIIISTASCMVLLFFHKHRLIILRRVFLLLGLLYLMRAITMYVTVLPMASRTYYCSPKLNNTSVGVVTLRAVKMLLGMGLTINGQHVFCGDYIFSGHTAILVMSYLVIQEYTPRSCVVLQWIAFLANIVGVIFLMMAHAHYTVDVVIAYYVTTRLFWMYHTLANNANLKQRGPNNYLSRVWWYPVFMYFERNVGGPVPRKYEWPLPWPRQFLSKYPERDS